MTRTALALLATIGVGMSVLACTDEPCTVVLTGTTAQWASLTADGWHGDPNDGREALYSPSCTTTDTH